MTIKEKIKFLETAGFETKYISDPDDSKYDKLQVWKKGYIEEPKTDNYDGITFWKSSGDFEKPMSEWIEELLEDIISNTREECYRGY